MTNKRPHWYDFKKVTLEDLRAQQDFDSSAQAETQDGIAGSGVHVTSPEERVIFDSDSLTIDQASWASELPSTFDGRGLLTESYVCSDRLFGNQISVLLEDSRTSRAVPTVVTIIGTDFNDNLTYEHIVCRTNGYRATFAHFKRVESILMQNFRGNADTSVDGYGSLNVGGRMTIAEAASCRTTTDLLVANQSRKPDVIFRDYKLYSVGQTLDGVLAEALRGEYDPGVLAIDTGIPEAREFSAGAGTDIIYAQKFRANTDNIQAISVLVALSSGADWTGALTFGIRKLQNPETFAGATRFLPNNFVDFDPELESLAEVSVTQDDLEKMGIVLDSQYREVTVSFSETPVANPTINPLAQDQWYALTVRRTGSTSVGALLIPEIPAYSGNTGYRRTLGEDFFTGGGRFSVFSSGQWLDVPGSTLWYKVFGDSIKVAGGKLIEDGIISINEKTGLNLEVGIEEQRVARGYPLTVTSTGFENYVIGQATLALSDNEPHPNTGDLTASRERWLPQFSAVRETSVEDILKVKPGLVVLARVTDRNPRGNQLMTGEQQYPGLVINNTADILNPSADLINRNVVGSIFTPNTAKPDVRYRIIDKQVFTDGYGDIDNSGVIELADLGLLENLDGYSIDLTTTGTYTATEQRQLVSDGYLDVLQLLRGDLNDDGVININDSDALNNFILNGSAFPSGYAQFTRVRLTLEPLLNPIEQLNPDGTSNLAIHLLDTDLLADFSLPVTWEIDPVSLWYPENVEVIDLRRKTISNYLDFSIDNLRAVPENGGTNNLYVPGDLYLDGEIFSGDGSRKNLDYERAMIELELPDGDTEGDINIFTRFVRGKMFFSDGTLVPNNAIQQRQVFFEVQVSSYAKNVGLPADGYDGYIDYTGPGDTADEAVGTYIDQNSGLLRIRAYNIVNNNIRPEIRTRIVVICNLKRAGWRNSVTAVSGTEVAGLLS